MNPQVLTFQHKPYALLPWRKRELSFTDYSLSELLVEGSNLEFATARKFLFDVEKGTETVDTTVGKFLIIILCHGTKTLTTYISKTEKKPISQRNLELELETQTLSYTNHR